MPVYSTVQTMTAKRSYALTANVVVRNTDPDHRIQVDSARYYNNEGALFREEILSLRDLDKTRWQHSVCP